jgi:hypothetical protein
VYLDKVYIRFKEQLPDSHNTFAAWEGFRELGVEIAPYYGFGDVETLEDLGPQVGIVGFLGDVWQALQKIGKPRPTPFDYPEELSPWMGRKVWKSTLGAIRRTITPVFIKPMEEKLFTGFIWRGGGMEAVRIATCPDDAPIWVSEIVTFVSEHRVYVKDQQILDVRRYKGDWGKAPHRNVVENAIKAFEASATRAYSLDFGITDQGETLLVEANDGYALGCYGMQPVLYAQMLEARWEELTR